MRRSPAYYHQIDERRVRPRPSCPNVLTPYERPSRSFGKDGPQRPLTLQELCWRQIKSHITAHNVLEMLEFMQQYSVPDALDLTHHCTSYVRQAYEMLRERRGLAALARVLPHDTLQQLEAAREERRRFLLVCSDPSCCHDRGGQVVEAPGPAPGSSCWRSNDVPSVGGHPHSYPLSALVAGVRWPPGVDPAHRERHLSPTDFERAFGMACDRYMALPAWRRDKMKKELRLW